MPEKSFNKGIIQQATLTFRMKESHLFDTDGEMKRNCPYLELSRMTSGKHGV